MSTVVKDLGAVSAYAYAVEKGYTGTEAEFAELMASYAEVGQTAVDAAESALNSKTAAQTAATTATNKASEATTAATTATAKAAEAQADADAAALDASQALSAASTATTKATEATTAAATATSAATTATTAKDDAVSAKTAAQTAQTGAETAAASVQSSAAQIATNTSDINELKEDLTDIANTYLLNGWPAGEITVGAFYSTDGNYVENANWSCVSDYFKVEQNVEYTAKTFTTDGRIIDPTYCVCFYDNSKAFIYGYLNQTQITAPNNAKYARLSVMNNYKTGFIFTDNYNAQYYPFGYRTSLNENIYDPHFELLKKSNPLYGKILCTVGDSITQGADMDADGIVATPAIETYQYNMSTEEWDAVTSQALATYGYQIAERNNMKFYNGGISGSVVAGLVARDGFSLANGRYTKLPDDIDYLTIWFGWNDYAAITDNEGETLGALYSTDITTFYGAWNTVLSYLINKYPYTKICLCVPYGANGDIRDAVRAVANYWGVAYWDNLQAGTPLYFNKEYGVTVKEEALTHNRSIFQANGAHPNYKGHKQLADMLEYFLKGI